MSEFGVKKLKEILEGKRVIEVTANESDQRFLHGDILMQLDTGELLSFSATGSMTARWIQVKLNGEKIIAIS